MTKITVICEAFDSSRYLPHQRIANKIHFIKINEIKNNPFKVFPIFFEILSCFFKKDYIFIAPLLLSPLIIFYLPLKWMKPNRVILDTSHIGWKKDEYPIEIGPLKPILKFLWFSFIKNLKIRAINRPAYNFLKNYTKKIALIPHCVDTKIFYRDKKVKKNKKFTILFVGKIEYKKGIDLILKAAKKLKNYNFWLVGKGSYEKKVKFSRLKNVKLLGYISNKKKLNTIYNQCHCLALPSRKYKGWEELFGIVIIEAMAAGLPVIASDCVGPREIIEKRKNGFLFRKKFLSEFINCMKIVKENNTVVKKIIQNAHKTVTEKYSLKKISHDLATLIKE